MFFLFFPSYRHFQLHWSSIKAEDDYEEEDDYVEDNDYEEEDGDEEDDDDDEKMKFKKILLFLFFVSFFSFFLIKINFLIGALKIQKLAL